MVIYTTQLWPNYTQIIISCIYRICHIYLLVPDSSVHSCVCASAGPGNDSGLCSPYSLSPYILYPWNASYDWSDTLVTANMKNSCCVIGAYVYATCDSLCTGSRAASTCLFWICVTDSDCDDVCASLVPDYSSY